MGEYKPLGSEKLNADDKLKRILQLTYYNQNNKKSSTNPELVKESVSGKVYGIVKEKDGYYVKMGLNEQSLDYIGGLFMKNKNRFSSYAEALKRLELMRGEDFRLNEATKYVLKKSDTNEQDQNPMPDFSAPAPEAAPAPAAAAPAPAPDFSAPAPDMSAPAPEAAPAPADSSTEQPPAEGQAASAESKRSDYMSEVQKFAGKLGQELRDQKEKMEGDDIKYVLNMVISAVDLDKLEVADLEEIGKKFERDEEAAEEPAAEEPAAEEPAAEEAPAETAEGELYELDEDPMKDLEEFINSEIDLSSYSDEVAEEDEIVEVDIEKVKAEVAQNVDEILKKYLKK